jgi:hypothetical protein
LKPALRSDGSSSQTSSNDGIRFSRSSNATLQNTASRNDLLAIPFEFSEDKDDSNGQLQKQNLFLSRLPQRVFAIDKEWHLRLSTTRFKQIEYSEEETQKFYLVEQFNPNHFESSIVVRYCNLVCKFGKKIQCQCNWEKTKFAYPFRLLFSATYVLSLLSVL